MTASPHEERHSEISEPTDRNLPADARLYSAVVHLLLEQGTDLFAEALTPDAVTKRAGKSRASYYRTNGFAGGDTTGGSRRAVVEQALARALATSANDVGQIVDTIDDLLDDDWAGSTPQQFIRAMTAENYQWMNSTEDLAQFLSASLAHSSPKVAADLAAFYSSVTRDYCIAYSKLLSFLGYRIRPPFTIEHFTTAIMAIAEGLLLRRSADSSITQGLYVDLIEHVATSLVMVDTAAAGRTLELDQPMRRTAEPPNRSAIIAAAVALFDRGRQELPTVDELALAANCSPRTVVNHFGGVAGAVRAAWQEWTPWFDESVEIDRRTMHDPDPLTLLYRVSIRIAQRACEHRGLTRAMLMSELGGMGGTSIDPISELLERLLLEAAERGEHVSPSTQNLPIDVGRIQMFAVTLRSNLLNIICVSPMVTGVSSLEHATRCVDYVWAMCLPARQQHSE